MCSPRVVTPSAVLLAVTAFAAVAFAQTPIPYAPTPSHQTDLPGVATGGAFADLDRDGWPDLVVANGNDIARQRVAVYRNRGNGVFPVNPDWQSADVDYHGHLDVGDVDGDGFLDVVVSVYLGAAGFGAPGKVKLYRNAAGTLGANPAWTSGDLVSTFACALGDVDLDGDLDLAVAGGESYQGPAERDRVYFNQGGTFQALPGWTSATTGWAMDIAFHDVDGDGDLDLLAAGARGGNRLYRNTGGTLGATPVWTSTDGGSSHSANSLVLGDLDGDALPELVVSDNSQLGGTGTFRAYRNLGTAFTPTPWWQSAVFANGYTSAVNLLDFDRDGDLDLVAGGWWTRTAIWRNHGTGLPATPAWQTTGTSVVEAICFADVNRDGLRPVTGEAKAVGGGRKLFACAYGPVESLQQVRADNVALAPGQYAFHRESGVLTLAQAPAASLLLDYTWSEAQDLGVTNWDANLGNYVFVRRPIVGVTVVPPPVSDFRAGNVIAWTETIASTVMNAQPAWYANELVCPGSTAGLPWLSLGAVVPPAFVLSGFGLQLTVPNPLDPAMYGDYAYRVRAYGPGAVLMSTAGFPFRLVP